MRTWWSVLLVVVACGRPHIKFSPHPATLTQEQRVGTFNTLRGTHEVRYRSCGRGGCSETETMMLADGREVHHVEDLIPLVPPGSVTARAAQDRVTAYDRALWWLKVGGATIAAGSGMIALGALPEEPDVTFVGFGALAVITGIAIIVIGGGINGARTREFQQEAIQFYNRDLMRSLNLCVVGLGVAPCETLGRP